MGRGNPIGEAKQNHDMRVSWLTADRQTDFDAQMGGWLNGRAA